MASDTDTEAAIQFYLEKLGYSELKTKQTRVVREFLGGKDVFGALATFVLKCLTSRDNLL